jgi:hypothetical protein
MHYIYCKLRDPRSFSHLWGLLLGANPCLFLRFKSAFKKIWFLFLFFSLLQINIFWCFWIILMRWYQKYFLTNKKIYYFNTFSSEKHFKKQPQQHTLKYRGSLVVCQFHDSTRFSRLDRSSLYQKIGIPTNSSNGKEILSL